MSSTIKSTVNASAELRITSITEGGHEVIDLRREVAGYPVEGGWDTLVPRAQFLTAVEAECGVQIYDNDAPWRLVPTDAIVILRDELPEVTYSSDGSGVNVAGGYGWVGAEAVPSDEFALAILAANRHRDAHPPVDEAQVDALALLVRDALGITAESVAAGTLRHGNSEALARSLYLAGVRIEVKP